VVVVRRIAMGLAIAVAIATVLGFIGTLFWAFDLIANFRLQLAVVALGVALVLIAARRPGVGAAMVVVALLNAAVIAPLYLRSPQPSDGGDTLSLVSFNIQLSNPQRQLDWILESDPDIVFLFESSRLAEDVLADMDLPYEIFSAIDDDRQYGPTALVRPGMSASKLPYSNEGGGAVRVGTTLDGQPVAVYGIHAPSPGTPMRAEARDRFLERSGRAVEDESIPVVVAGDLNTTPFTHGFELLTAPAELVNSQEGFGYTPTWPAQLPAVLRIPLDHVLHTADLTVLERVLGPRLSSDHLPVRAEIGFAVR